MSAQDIAQAQLGGDYPQPVRNKHWEEMSDTEKIAALRETVVWLARDLNAANAAISQLGQHRHAADGSLVAPLYVSAGGGNLNAAGYAPNYAHNLYTSHERTRGW